MVDFVASVVLVALVLELAGRVPGPGWPVPVEPAGLGPGSRYSELALGLRAELVALAPGTAVVALGIVLGRVVGLGTEPEKAAGIGLEEAAVAVGIGPEEAAVAAAGIDLAVVAVLGIVLAGVAALGTALGVVVAPGTELEMAVGTGPGGLGIVPVGPVPGIEVALVDIAAVVGKSGVVHEVLDLVEPGQVGNAAAVLGIAAVLDVGKPADACTCGTAAAPDGFGVGLQGPAGREHQPDHAAVDI